MQVKSEILDNETAWYTCLLRWWPLCKRCICTLIRVSWRISNLDCYSTLYKDVFCRINLFQVQVSSSSPFASSFSEESSAQAYNPTGCAGSSSVQNPSGAAMPVPPANQPVSPATKTHQGRQQTTRPESFSVPSTDSECHPFFDKNVLHNIHIEWRRKKMLLSYEWPDCQQSYWVAD